MLGYLLDVNVLIALFDPTHLYHDAAHDWLAENRSQGWATCAITVNGFVRIVSSPGYPARVPLSEAVAMLREFCSAPDHHYWPLAPSLTDASLFKPELIPGPRQITDVHLLATAVQHEGKLVTFDRTIAWRAVAPATQEHLVIPAMAA